MKVYYYNLYLMGTKEPYIISEEEGVKLTKLIAEGWRNKLLILQSGDLVINISSFSHLVREMETENIINNWDGKIIGKKEINRKLTIDELQAREKYNELRQNLSQNKKMISSQETKIIEETGKK